MPVVNPVEPQDDGNVTLPNKTEPAVVPPAANKTKPTQPPRKKIEPFKYKPEEGLWYPLIKWCLDTSDKVLGFLGLSVADLIDFSNDLGNKLIILGYSLIQLFLNTLLAPALFFLYPYMALLMSGGDNDKSLRKMMDEGMTGNDLWGKIVWWSRSLSILSMYIVKGFNY